VVFAYAIPFISSLVSNFAGEILVQDLGSAGRAFLPPDVTVGDCVQWSNRKSGLRYWQAETHLDLPVDSSRLFFLREGTFFGGQFTVVGTDEVSDKIGVDVLLHARQEGVIDDTEVCLLTRENGGDGVGILADYPREWIRGTRVEVVVRIPKAKSGALKIKSFETDLPVFRHRLHQLGDVFFDKLDLQTAAASVDAESTIVANVAEVKTAAGSIEGSFNATHLVLRTSNARIDVTFNAFKSALLATAQGSISATGTLFNDVSTDEQSTLKLETANAQIDGKINLSTLSKKGLGGSYKVTSETVNAKNVVAFPFISPDAELDLSVETAMANALVQLHESYEGEFTLHSGSFSKTLVYIRDDVKDPAGRGRKRRSQASGRRGEAKGRVWWGDEDGDQGKGVVRVETSFGNAELIV